LTLSDEIPLHLYSNSLVRLLHDFVAPIYPFIKAQFMLEYEDQNSSIGEEVIRLKSGTFLNTPHVFSKKFEFSIEVKDYAIHQILATANSKTISATCIK
jgi:hypothetical protein